jgi:cytoskeleton protein RodZ
VTEMTENNDMPEQSSHEPEQVLPGRRLREAREARRLTREEVAAQLRLQVRLIVALEEDDYDAMPSQTFVSGYLRSYARLLELPDNSFVTPMTSKHEPPPLVATIASKKQASSRDWFTRLVTYLIIGAIAVSVAMWWLAQRQGIEPEFKAPEPEIVEQGGNLSLTLPEAESPFAYGETVVPETEIGKQGGSMNQALPGEESQATEGDAAIPVPEEVAKAETQTVPVDAAVTVKAKRVQETVEESSKAEKAEPAPLTEDMPQSKLELRYEADSWTEVYDNAGRKLSYGLIKAGEVLLLSGEAPFRVFLGYAPGVTVYYNDELFDHSPFQRRDVARFRIGRAEHNHPGSR